MRLNELKPPRWSRFSPARKGRGIPAGKGKTSGRGHRGQNARSGGGVRRGFEGGQLPLYQRVPKRGFTNIFKKDYSIVNLNSLNCFEENSVITPQELQDRGLVKEKQKPIKILGEGELNQKLAVQAHAFSKSAVEKIEEAGGKVEVL